MALTLRLLTGGSVAVSVWLLSDNTPVVSRLTQAQYTAWGGQGDAPGRPELDARFLMAAGGIPALNTADGHANPEDCWEAIDPVLGPVLIITASRLPDWHYLRTVYSDPGVTKISARTGFKILCDNNRVKLTTWNADTLRDFDITTVVKRLEFTAIGDTVPNSRSVTFDSTANASLASAASLTIAGTVANQTDKYIAAMGTFLEFGVTLDTVTWNSVGLTSRLLSSPTDRGSHYWDLVNPDNGSFNLIFTFSAATDGWGGFISAYGVDQTTPRSSTGTNTGTSTAPTLTLTSAAGELVISNFGWVGGSTFTEDAGWTNDWAASSTWDPGSAGAHIAGAASVTRTGTLGTSGEWTAVGASLQASATADTSSEFLNFLF